MRHLKILAALETNGNSLTSTLRRMEDDEWIVAVEKRSVLSKTPKGRDRRGPRFLTSWKVQEAGYAILAQHFAWDDRITRSTRDVCSGSAVPIQAAIEPALAVESDYPKVGPDHSRYGKAGACQSVHHNTQDGCSNPKCTQYVEGRHVGA